MADTDSLIRIAMGVRYDGAAYHGWQSQAGLPTVQEKLEEAVSFVANQPLGVVCAGRTDAGVHATGQVVHFDTHAAREDYAWVFGTNSRLPQDIAIAWARPVFPDFHARFSATERKYRYIIYNHEVRPSILRNAVGWCHRPLNEKWMSDAAECLLGEHDFSAFRGSKCQANNPIRTIHEIEIYRRGQMLVLEVRANAFLLHMVRNIVGALVAVGSGERPVEWVRSALESCDRKQAGVTMVPQGLYLVEVNYPEHFALPERPLGPFFLA